MQTYCNDIYYWLAAIRLDGIGPIRLRCWLDYFGTLKKFFAATTTDLQSAGLTPRQINAVKNCDFRAVEKDLLWCSENNCSLITSDDEKYPTLLREIPDAPLLLFALGDVSLLSQPQLAIVGSRNPTPMGSQMAEEFGYYLTKAGLIVTSGLALGIDAASHKGALNAEGKTIAVCGSGLQHIYPASHRKLAKEIINNGAVISELPPDTRPIAKHFPMRNRVISGLSMGVLVVEAALRSGSLITARFAVDQGREVFALPGSIHNPLTRGCHQLIRQGAKLIETAEDILEELGALNAIIPKRSKDPGSKLLDTKQLDLLKQIGYEITSLDAIIMRSGLTAGEVSSMLLSLELEGYVQIAPGGYVRHS
ncbi:MAG: DNA-processing protein DprA [Gammaproteobacteria bacterium]